MCVCGFVWLPLSIYLFVLLTVCSGLVVDGCMCLFFGLLTQDAVTTTTTTTTTATTTSAAAAVSVATSATHQVASCDVIGCHGNTSSEQSSLAVTAVSCPIIMLTTESELADVGESFHTAEFPPQSDWLPVIQSSSSLTNHSSDLLTVQLLDVNDNYMKLDHPALQSLVLDESDLVDGGMGSDGSLSADIMSEGTHTSGCLATSAYCCFLWKYL